MDRLLAKLSALELAKEIREKKISPLELMQEYIKGVNGVNTKINAFSWLPEDMLLDQARSMTEKFPNTDDLPAFYGVPIPVKELSEVTDWPAHAGSAALGERKGTYDTHAVASLRKAGFILAGQTCSPEFGLLPVTQSERNGVSKNPWNLNRTCGGSSGGAAAAVAAGVAAIAHGSDGGGSIRIPASCCGLFGLKPSRGRISKGPKVSESFFGLSTDGGLTKSVADSAALLDHLSSPDPYAWNNPPRPDQTYLSSLTSAPKKLTVAICTENPMGLPLADSCKEAVLKTAALLEKAGHKVVEDAPDWKSDIGSATQDFMTIWSTATAGYMPPDWEKVEANTSQMYQSAKDTSAYDFMQALIRLQVFSRKILASWERFDLLLTPTLGLEPPAYDWLTSSAEEIMQKTMSWTPFTMWFNLSGQPACSFPIAMSDDGLPIGVHMVAPPWREELLLQICSQLEKDFPIQLAATL